MHLNDRNLAWMHRLGVTQMRFDASGNVLEIRVREWVGNDPLLAEPEAPVPPPVPELTDEQIRENARKRAIQIRAEFAADQAEAYRQATGLEPDPEQPQ